MYQELHRWDECIAVAEAKVYLRSCLLRDGSELGSTNIRNLLLSRRLWERERGWGWELAW